MSLRKHKCFSQCDKLKIIEAYEAGKSRSDIMHEFGLPLSSYYKIISNKYSTKQQCLQGKGYVRRNRSSDYPNLERCLLHWINQKFGAEGHPLEGPVIKAQAKLFSLKLGIDEFSASNGWLDGFKKRHGLTFNRTLHGLYSNGERNSTDWKDCFTNLLDEYEAKDIYSFVVTGLFYKCLPEQILKYQTKECRGGENEQDRVTVLLCANITGTEKLPILVIGQSKRPECLEDKHENTTFMYKSNGKAWMTGAIFVAWLTELNDRMISDGRQIVLLVNHFHVLAIFPKLSNVKIVMQPAKITFDSIQPQHKDLIYSFKWNYRSDVVTYLMSCRQKRTKPNINLPYVLDAAVRAWQHVGSDTIVNHFMQAGCWPYTLCESLSQQEEKDTIARPSESDWDKLALQEPKPSFSGYIRVDEKVAVTGMFNDDEIVMMATTQYQPKSKQSTDNALDTKELLDVKKTSWRRSVRTTRTSVTDRKSRQLYVEETEDDFMRDISNSCETLIDQRDPIICKRDALKALKTLHKFFERHTYQKAATFDMLYELEKCIQAI